MTQPNAQMFSANCVFRAGGDGKDWDTTLNVFVLVNLNTPVASFSGHDQQEGRTDIPNWHDHFVELGLSANPTFDQIYHGLLYVGIVPHHGKRHDTFEFDVTARLYFTDATVWEVDIPNQTLVNESAHLWRLADGTVYQLAKDEQDQVAALLA
jgi:hypothetical protein